MNGEYDGPRSWAQAVFIQGKVLGTDLRARGPALFHIPRGRISLWGRRVGRAAHRLRPRPGNAATLTRLAEVDLPRLACRRGGSQAAQGRPPVPRPVLPRPEDMSELDWAAQPLESAPAPPCAARSVAGDRLIEALGFVREMTEFSSTHRSQARLACPLAEVVPRRHYRLSCKKPSDRSPTCNFPTIRCPGRAQLASNPATLKSA